jgi:hypothetical protein
MTMRRHDCHARQTVVWIAATLTLLLVTLVVATIIGGPRP